MISDEPESIFPAKDWQQLDLHSDNGLSIFMKRQPKRLVTCSQEVDDPPFLDLRPMTLAPQNNHFNEASLITGIDYSVIADQTEHDMQL